MFYTVIFGLFDSAVLTVYLPINLNLVRRERAAGLAKCRHSCLHTLLLGNYSGLAPFFLLSTSFADDPTCLGHWDFPRIIK